MAYNIISYFILGFVVLVSHGYVITDLSELLGWGVSCSSLTCLPGKHCIQMDLGCDTPPCETAICVNYTITNKSQLKSCDNIKCTTGFCDMMYTEKRGYFPICVPPSLQGKNKTCGKNKIWNPCYVHCNAYCDWTPELECEKKACDLPGCACAPGFVRSDYYETSPCIAATMCKGFRPKTGCPRGEKLVNCSSPTYTCDIKCGTRDTCYQLNSTCDTTSCGCLPNYKQNYAGDCVHNQFCHRYVKCAANEKWSDCAGYNVEASGNRTSTKACYSGCACVDGFIRNVNGTCITKDK